MSTNRVYQYGLLPPTTNGALVRDQIRRGHQYHNELIALERERRDKLRAAMSSLPAIAPLQRAVAEAKERLDEALATVKASRKKTRSRSEAAEDRERARLARETLRHARAELGAARQQVRQDRTHQQRVDSINTMFAERQKQARARYVAAGGYWGTYQLHEMAIDQARKMPLYDGSEPNDPWFVRWDGCGAVGVQLQGGCSVDDVLSGKDTQLRIRTGLPALRRDGTPMTGRRAQHRAELQIRVQSEGRAPVWATFPMILHRPLPEAAVVKRAQVQLRRVAAQERWVVSIGVELPEGWRDGQCGDGAVAIDIGWRVMGDELRVAYWRDTDGNGGELRLDAKMLSSLRKADELRSIRDRNFDDIRTRLVGWMRRRLLGDLAAVDGVIGVDLPVGAHPQLGAIKAEANPAITQTQPVAVKHETGKVEPETANVVAMPEWMRRFIAGSDDLREADLPSSAQAVAWLAQWRSQARMAALVRRWRDNRFAGDDEGYAMAEAWRYHDFHLWEWESHQRDQAIRHRREFYRIFAAQMARRYETLVVEEFDLRGMARRAPAEAPAENETARSNRHLAALSELRGVLANAFARRGGKVAKQDPADSTRECHACGHVEAFDASAVLSPTCRQCGARVDQDDRACVNLLARWLECQGGDDTPGGARGGGDCSENDEVDESKWSRVARLRREKRRRDEGARTKVDMAAE